MLNATTALSRPHLSPVASEPVADKGIAAQPKYVADESGTGIIVEGDTSGIAHMTLPTKDTLADLNSGGHSPGMHVAATALGGSINRIRIAPGAQIIAARALEADTPDSLKALQLMLTPRSSEDVTASPNVIDNSWGGNPPGTYLTALRELPAFVLSPVGAQTKS